MASCIKFLFFINFLFPLILALHQHPETCNGRWIHIRKLPFRFNLDLLTHCSDYAIYRNFCPYISNHGLGPKTHNLTHSWYRTEPHMLELIFHRRMLEYPCLTVDPTQANAIYLPYYAGIDALRYLYGPDLNSSADHGLDLYGFLRDEDSQIWERNNGHDHFLVMARPAWDFSQPPSDTPVWGTSFLELPEFYNVTALTLESRAWPWQERAVPYPTSFHPASRSRLESWLARVRRTRRTKLMLFAGGGGGPNGAPNVRRSIRAECENASSRCELVDCSKGVCEHDPIRYMRAMLRASFCLQPPGDTPTRRSTFDGILAGCIPVFFEEVSARSQFRWHLPEREYTEFSVYIPKEDVVGKGLRIAEVLKGISRADVRRMRERVMEMVERVTYRRHGSSVGMRSTKDAFDIAVEESIGRIKERLSQVDR